MSKNNIDIQKARNEFKKFLEKYRDKKEELGFELKVVHTYHVVENAKKIAMKLNLPEEDIDLAELIALLHDIGRFEEITFLKQFDNVKFDHASYGIRMLFEDNLIRDFIETDIYDEIIKKAIYNHNRLSIEDRLSERCLLHAKIIRDADKLDNFRVKKEETIEAIFPGKVKNKTDIENSTISDKVYETVKSRTCIDVHDRTTILDYWVCNLAFVFDLSFKETFEIVKNHDYINILIDRFNYSDITTQERMENIRAILNGYIDENLMAFKRIRKR